MCPGPLLTLWADASAAPTGRQPRATRSRLDGKPPSVGRRSAPHLDRREVERYLDAAHGNERVEEASRRLIRDVCLRLDELDPGVDAELHPPAMQGRHDPSEVRRARIALGCARVSRLVVRKMQDVLASNRILELLTRPARAPCAARPASEPSILATATAPAAIARMPVRFRFGVQNPFQSTVDRYCRCVSVA